jgi:hypothetical protein
VYLSPWFEENEMFGLLSPSGTKVSRVRRPAHLFLERLESRDNPSTLSVSVLMGSGSNMTLTGTLTNAPTLSNQAISITGVTGGTAYTDANGDFSITLPDTGGSGYVYAQTQDDSSNVASASVAGGSPGTLTLSISSYGPGKEVTLTGSLSSTSNNANQTITITGVASGTATTDANGDFSVTLNASGLGKVYAEPANGSANVATATLTDEPPDVYNFGGAQVNGNLWDFSGTVSWEESWTSMSGTIVGPPKIGTVSITATSDGEMNNGECTGRFSVAILLDGTQATNGNYIAQVKDCWGTLSNEAIDCVNQPGT